MVYSQSVGHGRSNVPQTFDTPMSKSGMRPNIEISHQLNGRVKDLAVERGETSEETYREIIEAGLEVLED